MTPTSRSGAIRHNYTHQCGVCDKTYHPFRRSSTFCSAACRHESKKRRVTTPCQTCGRTIEVKASHLFHTKYCSLDCRDKSYTKRYKGKNNPNFQDKGRRTCEGCGKEYKSYDKGRRFCSVFCSQKLSHSWGLSHVKRGTEAEYWCYDLLASLGYVVMKTKASRGIFDLYAFNREELIGIQVKRTKEWRRRFPPCAIRAILKSPHYKVARLRKQLWSYVDEGPRMGWYILDL